MFAFFSKPSKQAIDECAQTLVDELSKRYPLKTAQAKQDAKHRKAIGKALDAAYVRAQAFHTENKLGVYGKARLGNTFQWALKEQGYPEGFVQEATKGLLLSLE